LANPYAILNEFIRYNSEAASFQKEKIKELTVKDFPFSDSELFVNALRRINEEIIKKFDLLELNCQELHKRYDEDVLQDIDNTYNEIHEDLLFDSQLMWSIGELTHYVEASGREHVSQSTVFLVSYLTKQYEQSSSFFLTPLNEHNFQYRNLARRLRKLIKDSIPSAETILHDLRQNFSILSFPGIYRDNIVANILLAHEVGHFIVDTNKLESQITPKVRIDTFRLYEYSKRVASTPVDSRKKQPKISDFLDKEQIKTNISKSLVLSIESWIRELLSDMIGFKLSGPVFIFALANELLSMFPHGLANNNYPPPSLRLKFILNEIEKCGYVAELGGGYKEAVKNLIEEIKSYIETPSLQSKDEFLHIVYDAINSVTSDINQVADKNTINMQYSPKSFGNDIPILLDKLMNIIPPCEISSNVPANIISILNAGMIYKMTWRKDQKYYAATVDDIEQTERTINALVLRSIEMSVLQQQCLNHLGE
jgi:hypothetical protein